MADSIFQPLQFKNLTVKNRIFRSNISGRLDNYDGSGNQARINWEVKFARGGVGAIISSFVPVQLHGRIMPNYATVDTDDKIPFWRKVGEEVRFIEVSDWRSVDVDQDLLAGDVAGRIAASLEQPFVVQGLAIDVEPSIGIALYPDHGTDVDALLQRADVAMYVAKEARSGVEIYSPANDRNSPARLGLLGDLRRAIDRHELELHYQPKVRLSDRRMTGVEALLRWPGAAPEIASPMHFVPVLEETGLLDRLGPWLMREAVKTHRDWRAKGFDAPRIAVNVSASQLRSRDYLAQVCDAVGGAPDDCGLDLEITESMLMPWSGNSWVQFQVWPEALMTTPGGGNVYCL